KPLYLYSAEQLLMANPHAPAHPPLPPPPSPDRGFGQEAPGAPKAGLVPPSLMLSTALRPDLGLGTGRRSDGWDPHGQPLSDIQPGRSMKMGKDNLGVALERGSSRRRDPVEQGL